MFAGGSIAMSTSEKQPYHDEGRSQDHGAVAVGFQICVLVDRRADSSHRRRRRPCHDHRVPAVVRPVADERDALLTFLAQERYVLRLSAYGLTEDQVRLRPTASDLSIGGLLEHVTTVERSWAIALSGRDADDTEARAVDRTEEPDPVAELLRNYDDATAATDAVVSTEVDLARSVPVPPGARWAPPDVTSWSVRWVLLHLIHETARHAGHADIIRESIDGATAFPLMAAAEGWAPRRTIQPWSPKQ
jgi:uncharacterized damage-inducible protein DinB